MDASPPVAVRLLLVEDDREMADNVAALLRGEGFDVEWAAGIADALAAASARTPDLVLLDRMLPDGDGLTLLKALRAQGVAAPVLMLSALGRTDNRIEGLDAGADDYLAKPFEPHELVARLRALHRRSARGALSPVIVHGELECHVKARTAHRAGKHIPLSPREFDLFHYLISNAGEVVTRDMLLRHVWKLNFDPQTNVIDVNVGRLRRKLEDGFATPVLETIWGSGYRLTGGGG